MAERLRSPRQFANALVPQPLNISKKKQKKKFTAEEQEEVKKHEIKTNQFTYRLRSVREILDQMHSETESTQNVEGVETKKRRRSMAKRGGRRSIAESTLIRNAKLEDEKEKICCQKAAQQMDIGNVGNSGDVLEEKVKENNNDIQQVSEVPSDFKRFEDQNDNQKATPIEKEAEKDSIEDTEEQKEEALKNRKETLATLEKLRNEQEEWAKLLKKHDQLLTEEKMSSISVEEGKEFLSDEQRKFLENRIDPDKFLDHLQYQADQFCGNLEYVTNFAEKLNEFKKHAAKYLQLQTQNLAKNEFEGEIGIETPRRLITKITRSAVE